MRKLSLIVSLSILLSFGLINVASAKGATINFGKCMSSMDPALKPYQAPGKTGNGPLNSASNAKGTKLSYGSFDGGQGCLR